MTRILGVENEYLHQCNNERILYEMIRSYHAGPLHNTCSLLGGVVGQIILKFLLKQFVPINNMLIYNGISSTMDTYTL